jgi:hypothetical protein
MGIELQGKQMLGRGVVFPIIPQERIGVEGMDLERIPIKG